MTDVDTIHPGPFRIKIQPSQLEAGEEQKQSGLIVQRQTSGTKLKRGVIVDVGPGVIEDDDDKDRWPFVRTGSVIYYRGGYDLGDHVYLDVSHETIIAYEDAL